MQELWERVCQLKYGHSQEVAELRAVRVCANGGINVCYNFANAQSEDINRETQTMVAQKEQNDKTRRAS